MKTDDKTLIEALRILAREIQSDDGVANACIAEAADRLDDFHEALVQISEETNDEFAENVADLALGIAHSQKGGEP